MPVPNPHVGLVINYEYLWKNESDKGAEDGKKTRPTCIIAKVTHENDKDSIVLVLPITHSPQNPSEALKIPPDVKRFIGLDDEDQWVICSEVNKFIWPGCDIRPTSKDTPENYTFGTITSGFLRAIQTKVRTLREGKQLRVVSRTV